MKILHTLIILCLLTKLNAQDLIVAKPKSITQISIEVGTTGVKSGNDINFVSMKPFTGVEIRKSLPLTSRSCFNFGIGYKNLNVDLNKTINYREELTSILIGYEMWNPKYQIKIIQPYQTKVEVGIENQFVNRIKVTDLNTNEQRKFKTLNDFYKPTLYTKIALSCNAKSMLINEFGFKLSNNLKSFTVVNEGIKNEVNSRIFNSSFYIGFNL